MATNRLHHEKLSPLITNYQICFIGGLDLCFSCCDSFDHKVGITCLWCGLGRSTINPRYKLISLQWDLISDVMHVHSSSLLNFAIISIPHLLFSLYTVVLYSWSSSYKLFKIYGLCHKTQNWVLKFFRGYFGDWLLNFQRSIFRF